MAMTSQQQPPMNTPPVRPHRGESPVDADPTSPGSPAQAPQHPPVVPSPSPVPSFHKPLPTSSRPEMVSRRPSRSGTIQAPGENHSGSEPANTNATPSEAGDGTGSRRGGRGMFAFLKGKGRERSPKPSEAGVLGKEGARQIVH